MSRPQIDEATQMKVLRLHNEGLNLTQLADRLGGIVSMSSIRRILKDTGK